FLTATAVAAGLLGAPLLGSAHASASCARDPYSHVCVRTVKVRLKGRGKVYVQRNPHQRNALRRVSARGSVWVICQINGGGAISRHRDHTWSAISGGGWVPSSALRMSLDRHGYTPGIRHCGSHPAPAAPRPAAPAPPSAPSPTPSPSESPAPAPSQTATPTPTPTEAALNPADYPWPAQDGWAGDGHG